MKRHNQNDDDWDDEEFDNSDDEPTIDCPYCRREIHEDSQRCPYCERYISDEDSPPTRKPWWIYVTVGLLLFVMLDWLLWALYGLLF
ncbi:hypothetical protein ETAA8_04200 [Anatilimnocola aggregata]|uniref:Zinc ribbon domain-containing protein n=1 Tax=Anatilimnocola aggregata TaxID=2528021 RepID=A0A517Y529_9BACT|nr:zinc ribbon domain-containing protein [Anatilimnocola aggregata]QDU25354.1 hypothetical protein ETAA8_04200 [Anatilimnocola aggregata]